MFDTDYKVAKLFNDKTGNDDDWVEYQNEIWGFYQKLRNYEAGNLANCVIS